MAIKLANPDLLKIVYYPDPRLRKICAPIEEFSPEVHALADRMLVLLREARGVGLAAPQVGVAVRLFVCNTSGEPGDDLICVNPTLCELTGADQQEEGCLSIPGVTVAMRRATRVVMEAFDPAGKPFRRTGDRLVARIWQHELDHLNGRLITDYMSPADELANRRALKLLKADYTAARRAKQSRRCASSS